jgi:hypothetical protein
MILENVSQGEKNVQPAWPGLESGTIGIPHHGSTDWGVNEIFSWYRSYAIAFDGLSHVIYYKNFGYIPLKKSLTATGIVKTLNNMVIMDKFFCAESGQLADLKC